MCGPLGPSYPTAGSPSSSPTSIQDGPSSLTFQKIRSISYFFEEPQKYPRQFPLCQANEAPMPRCYFPSHNFLWGFKIVTDRWPRLPTAPPSAAPGAGSRRGTRLQPITPVTQPAHFFYVSNSKRPLELVPNGTLAYPLDSPSWLDTFLFPLFTQLAVLKKCPPFSPVSWLQTHSRRDWIFSPSARIKVYDPPIPPHSLPGG